MNKGLSNPVATAAAASALKKGGSFLFRHRKPIAIGVAVLFVGYLVYDKFFKPSFKKIGFDSSQPQATISTTSALTRADAIEASKGIFNDNEDLLFNAFKGGLNSNDFVKIYNAFQLRDDMNLIEFLNDFLNEDELNGVRFLISGTTIF